MNKRENFKGILLYCTTFLKWFVLATIIGLVGGVIGSLFHICIDYVTELRVHNSWLILLLPAGGILIAFVYKLCSKYGKLDTNRIIKSVQSNDSVPFILAPLIFFGASVTHLLGGSAGREGAALQLGGSIGYRVGRISKLREEGMHVAVMTGMASVFSALFGTPVTAAVFAIEVASVGIMHYGALLPCVIASVAANIVSVSFGIEPVRFIVESITGFNSAVSFLQITLIAVLCALVSILFCTSIRKCESLSKKYMSNVYLRSAFGGLLVVILTIVLQTTDYNGAGMDIIEKAISGNARYEAFILKLVFTVITIAAGFKGGEIVPTFFIGSTFGCAVATILGFNPAFGAALGFVAMFCGVVNCPMASLILSVEVFGSEGVMVFAYVCAISYILSGNYGLYKSQKIVYSKLDEKYIDVTAK